MSTSPSIKEFELIFFSSFFIFSEPETARSVFPEFEVTVDDSSFAFTLADCFLSIID